ncbi:HAD-IA family hydrolase [Candidatus Micrarchaeota archaeon]|nr:HAD-IA family hydrolase [Candidatus Micrarchaeota archaeon]
MRIFADSVHSLLTVVFTVALWAAFINSAYDVFPALFLAVIAYALAGVARPAVKKYLFRKAVVFDIHGVYLEGDIHLEELYENRETKVLIQRLQKKYKVACLTNLGPEMWGVWSSKWRLQQLFDYSYASWQLKIKKPDAKLYQAVLKDMMTRPQDAVFIDDLAQNVEGAKKAGMKGIVFKDAQQAESELKKIGFGP